MGGILSIAAPGHGWWEEDERRPNIDGLHGAMADHLQFCAQIFPVVEAGWMAPLVRNIRKFPNPSDASGHFQYHN